MFLSVFPGLHSSMGVPAPKLEAEDTEGRANIGAAAQLDPFGQDLLE